MFIRLQFRYKHSVIDTRNITLDNIDQLKLGNYSSIGKGTVLVACKKTRESKIIVGEHTYIGEYNNLRAADGIILIGNNCLISQFVTMVTANHLAKKGIPISKQPWYSAKGLISIGNDVWIGAGATILPDVLVADGAVIGAGAVVTKNVPENAIVVGNPARILKYREI